MHHISLSFEDYLSFISEEGIDEPLPVQEQKVTRMREMLINAAYMVNRLRRKQAIIEVKRKIESAIKLRGEDCETMKAQIREAEEIMREEGEAVDS